LYQIFGSYKYENFPCPKRAYRDKSFVTDFNFFLEPKKTVGKIEQINSTICSRFFIPESVRHVCIKIISFEHPLLSIRKNVHRHKENANINHSIRFVQNRIIIIIIKELRNDCVTTWSCIYIYIYNNNLRTYTSNSRIILLLLYERPMGDKQVLFLLFIYMILSFTYTGCYLTVYE